MKLAVILPGIGYHCEKPLLYYSKKAAKNAGYEIFEVPYGGFPKDAKSSQEKMVGAFLSALSQTEEMLKNVNFAEYDELLFITKSVGTVVAAAFEEKHGIKARNIFYTPVEATFSHGKHEGIAFHGTSDPWAETQLVRDKCAEHGLPLYITENADHSLETGNVSADIENLLGIMKTTEDYINAR